MKAVVAEVHADEAEEVGRLARFLGEWRDRFPNAGLIVGACDYGAGEYRVRLATSNSDPVELLLLADRMIEEAAALLAPEGACARPLLTKAEAARAALGFLQSDADPKGRLQ